MSYYSKKVEEIRKKIEFNVYPPKFNPKHWRFIKANCYAYALNLPINDGKKEIFIPGCISENKEQKAVWTDVTGEVKKDLEFLGFKYREDDENLNQGEWRIAIYFRPTPHDFPIGFHISRQDSDGYWSEKASWKAKISKFKKQTNTPPNLTEYNLILEKVLILSKK